VSDTDGAPRIGVTTGEIALPNQEVRRLSRLFALALMGAVLGAAMLASPPSTARAVYQCKTSDGRTTMQDRPCDATAQQSEIAVQDTYRGTPLKAKRSAKAKREFQRDNPCPRTGATRGRCPGHDIDHIQPLCAGGPDTPENMQWLTLEQHREKTRRDVFECRVLRGKGSSARR